MPINAPVLKLQELVACLTDYGLEVSAEDLKAPTVELVYHMYTDLAQSFLRFNLEELQQPRFELLEGFTGFPQLYEDALPRAITFQLISQVCKISGVDNFSMKDLLEPEGKRTRRILSFLVNFSKFRTERVAALQEFKANTDELTMQMTQAKNDNDTIALKIRELEEKREQEAEESTAVKKQVEELTGELHKLHGKSKELQAEIRKAKDRQTELADKMAQMIFETETIKQDTLQLRSQIVQSPDRIQRQIAQRRAAIDEQKQAVAKAEEKLAGLKQRVQDSERALLQVNKTVKLLEDIGGSVGKSTQLKQSIAALQEQISAQVQLLHELGMQELHINQQISLVTSRHQANIKRDEFKVQSARQALHEQEEELERQRQGHNTDTSGHQLDIVKAEHEASFRQDQQLHERLMAKMEDDMRHLERQLTSYHSSIQQRCLAAC